jgi:hypothetical protein
MSLQHFKKKNENTGGFLKRSLIMKWILRLIFGFITQVNERLIAQNPTIIAVI